MCYPLDGKLLRDFDRLTLFYQLISVAPSCAIQLNVTGILLRDFAEVQFDILRDGSGDSLKTNGIIPPSALSTVGLRRASESRSVTIQNSTGLDIEFIPESFLSKDDPVFVKNGTRYTLKYTIEGKEDDELTLALRIASSAVDLIGDREPVRGLPVGSRSKHVQLYLLKSSSPLPAYAGLFGFIEGRTSPETILSETTDTFGWGYYNAEPVVEWCMQNQRLKPTVADLYSLPKGRDLLSNSVWSPEDEVHEGDFHYKEVGPHIHVYSSENADASKVLRVACSPEQASNKLQNNSNWLPPYLTEDSPEWTDMTCMLRMARERFMLPDNRWMWVNEWSVEINGKLGKDTDADGWSYANDFGAFSNTKYFYGRGATCRRRRWTRTVRIFSSIVCSGINFVNKSNKQYFHVFCITENSEAAEA